MSDTVPNRPVLGVALAGAAATFSGIGLSRFAFVPLFPAMVAAGWISGPQGGLLGAFNLAGYLAGVLGGRRIGTQVGTAATLDLGMAAAVAGFAGCGWNGGLAWLCLCRFISGLAGGTLMALAGPAVQESVPAERRGLAGGVVVSGVGFGIMAGSTVVPAALSQGVSTTWLALAAVVAAAWLAARTAWPRAPVVAPSGRPARASILVCSYGISGAGLVPHMVYFADLAVRGRGFPPGTGPLLWLAFGAGTITGTIVAGRVADRLGGEPALRAWLGIQVVALATSLLASAPALYVSAFLGGFSALGLTAIALARARELAGPGAGLIWVRATASFAVAQAVTGFALAALFGRTGSHDAVFGAGLALSVAALALALLRSDRPAAT